MILLHRCQFCGALCTRNIDGVYLCDSANCEAVARGCKGFRWIGQSWDCCDGCGKPYWEHAYNQEFNRNMDPFGNEDCWLYVPISEESKARMKARYMNRFGPNAAPGPDGIVCRWGCDAWSINSRCEQHRDM